MLNSYNYFCRGACIPACNARYAKQLSRVEYQAMIGRDGVTADYSAEWMGFMVFLVLGLLFLVLAIYNYQEYVIQDIKYKTEPVFNCPGGKVNITFASDIVLMYIANHQKHICTFRPPGTHIRFDCSSPYEELLVKVGQTVVSHNADKCFDPNGARFSVFWIPAVFLFVIALLMLVALEHTRAVRNYALEKIASIDEGIKSLV